MAKFSKGNLDEQCKKLLKNNRVIQTIVSYLNPPTKKVFARLKAEMISEFRQLPVVEAIEYGPGFGDNDFAGILGGTVCPAHRRVERQ